MDSELKNDVEKDKLTEEISRDEKKILNMMRIFDLSYSELTFVFQEGLLPAIQSLGKYKNPPWTKETLPELDRYHEQLSTKYETLYGFFEEGKKKLQ